MRGVKIDNTHAGRRCLWIYACQGCMNIRSRVHGIKIDSTHIAVRWQWNRLRKGCLGFFLIVEMHGVRIDNTHVGRRCLYGIMCVRSAWTYPIAVAIQNVFYATSLTWTVSTRRVKVDSTHVGRRRLCNKLSDVCLDIYLWHAGDRVPCVLRRFSYAGNRILCVS